MALSAVFVYRWLRLVNSAYRKIPKHHLWMLNRPLATSFILERGKGIKREPRMIQPSNIEVRCDLSILEVSIASFYCSMRISLSINNSFHCGMLRLRADKYHIHITM